MCRRKISVFGVLAICGAAGVVSGGRATWAALSPDRNAPGPAPDVLDLKQLSLEIVKVSFVDRYEGVNATFDNKGSSEVRGAVVTLRVRKPAGSEVTLHAPDLALHYRHGQRSDVVPCLGISTFSTDQEGDRLMMLFSAGYGSSSTRLGTTNAEVAYVDLFYGGMEPDTRDVHLLVAQPTQAAFQTIGWEPRRGNKPAVRAIPDDVPSWPPAGTPM